jgi:hypothetical protein
MCVMARCTVSGVYVCFTIESHGSVCTLVSTGVALSNRPVVMIPAVLALLPALALTAWTRAHWPDEAQVEVVQEEAGQALLEVLIAEGGYRIRVTDLHAEGWQPPLRSANHTPVSDRQTFVARAPGLPAHLVMDAALELLGDRREPVIQLRAEDAIPWYRLVEAGEALEPLLGRTLESEGLLAGVLVDARP